MRPRVPTEVLRVFTCGSVDDGKSTLIGRLLHDAGALYDDERDRLRNGASPDEWDFAALVDGLLTEREQGITIDAAYRAFHTPARRYILADTPGHQQYTRNMATGASTADLAVLVLDVQRGLSPQTRRHACVLHHLGIRDVVLALNKVDLVGYDADAVRHAEMAFRAYVQPFAFRTLTAVPVSARCGDNVVHPSTRTPWYDGPTLVACLDGASVHADAFAACRFPVQIVLRGEPRAYGGTVAAGTIVPGQTLQVARTGQSVAVARVLTLDHDIEAAHAGDAVALTLADDLDLARGDMLVAPETPPQIADRVSVDLLWFAETPLEVGAAFLLAAGPKVVSASVTSISHRVDVDADGRLVPAHRLHLNDIGRATLALSEPMAFDAYGVNRETGAGILIDRRTNDTVAGVMLRGALAPAADVHWQPVGVGADARAAIKAQRPCVLWFTGISAAGKSTIAAAVEARLAAAGHHTAVLDGDNLRHGLNRDLGFTDVDRAENVRRTAEVARLMVDAGLIVLVALISPFETDRRAARRLIGDRFIEIFVDTPLDVAEARDRKGLYRKAREGRLTNFTGIDSPYEPPASPDVHLVTPGTSIDALADRVVAELARRGVLRA